MVATLKPHGLEASVDYSEDSRRLLGSVPAESIDLIYLDQPFFSSWIQQSSWADLNSGDNRWAGGVNEYFDWMATPLTDMHRVLKPSGALFLICDEAVGLYIRLLLDDIFEQGSTLSQKILCETDCGPAHHSIFYYRKSTPDTARPDNFYSVIRREGDKDCAVVAFSFLGHRLVRRNL